MLALVGAVLALLATALAYWTAMQGFVKEPTTNQLRADLRAAELEIKILQATLASVQQARQAADDKLAKHGEDLAALKALAEKKAK
jgi:hypothetical protein